MPKLAHNTGIVPQLPGIGKCDIYKLTIHRPHIRIGLPYQGGYITMTRAPDPLCHRTHSLWRRALSLLFLGMLVAFLATCARSQATPPSTLVYQGPRP